MAQAKILIVEDEPVIALNIKRRLMGLHYNVVGIATNKRVALEMMVQHHPHLVLMDIHLDGNDNGIDVALQIREQFNCPVVFLTAHADPATLEQAKAARPFGYIVKPFETHDLRSTVEVALARYQAEQAIRDQAQERISDLRTSITTSLPHEFWTPLNSITVSIDLLRFEAEAPDPTRIREIADILERCNTRLHQLIQKFLLYAKIELLSADVARLEELRSQTTLHPVNWVKEVAHQSAQSALRPNDLDLQVTHNAIIPISETHFTQLLKEVIENAFKFSTAGTSVIVATQVDGDRFRLTIADQGRGMTAEQVQRVGEAYAQFERSHYEQQGVGLGLAIVKRLIELHRGQWMVTSSPDDGTTVQINFPVVPAVPPTRGAG